MFEDIALIVVINFLKLTEFWTIFDIYIIFKIVVKYLEPLFHFLHPNFFYITNTTEKTPNFSLNYILYMLLCNSSQYMYIYIL